MTVDIDVPQLYRGRAINLWVEDAVVAAYLREVWSDREIQILIAGGSMAVESLAKHAQENGYQNVFGLTDRDFGSSNYPDWQSPEKTFQRFTLPVHELENLLLLDSNALAGSVTNDNRKSITEVDSRISQLAQQLVPYMACRAAIAELRHVLLDEFPTHPKRDAIPDLDAAAAAICGSPWFNRIARDSQSHINPVQIRQRLAFFEHQYIGDLQSGQWRATFSGKELFHDVASYIYQGKGIRGQQRDVDVAKAVARWQNANQAIPVVVEELRNAMRARLAKIPPAAVAST